MRNNLHQRCEAARGELFDGTQNVWHADSLCIKETMACGMICFRFQGVNLNDSMAFGYGD